MKINIKYSRNADGQEKLGNVDFILKCSLDNITVNFAENFLSYIDQSSLGTLNWEKFQVIQEQTHNKLYEIWNTRVKLNSY